MKTDFEVLDQQYLDFDDFLDDSHQEIKICILTYSASQVLKAVDPIAYELGFEEYLDFISE